MPALIVLAALPPPLFAMLDGLRRTHYPATRNHVPAHCTLIRTLPPSAADEARRTLAAAAADHAPLPARLGPMIAHDDGTALAVHSPALEALHTVLVASFHGLLTQADQTRPRFHITLQHHATRQAARALQSDLGRPGALPTTPFPIPALTLVRWDAGAWTPLGHWPLRGGGRA